MSVLTLEGYRPSERHDGEPWTIARIEGADTATGPWGLIEQFTLSPVEPDPTSPLERDFTTENVADETWARVVFVDGDGDEETTLPVPLAPVTFATRRDVAARLGRELTDAEEGQVDLLLAAATELVTEAVDQDAVWAAGPDVPNTLRWICTDVVVRSLNATPGVTATREQLGAYSVSQSFSDQGFGGGLMLTQAEERLARRVVWGTNSGSAVVASIVDDLPVTLLNGDGP